jgi:hypothetical protein
MCLFLDCVQIGVLSWYLPSHGDLAAAADCSWISDGADKIHICTVEWSKRPSCVSTFYAKNSYVFRSPLLILKMVYLTIEFV